MLRIRLYNEGYGEYVINDVDPDGLNNFEIELKRSSKSDGVFYEFSIDLDFNKGARNFIKKVYETYGIDGEIKVDLFEYEDNNYRFLREYTGQLRLPNYSLDETTVSCNIEQVGFQRKFLNNEDVNVDLEATQSLNGIALNENPIITMPLASKSIKKKGFAFCGDNYINNSLIGFNRQIRFGGDFEESDFEDLFLTRDSWTRPDFLSNPYGNGDENERPSAAKNFILKAREDGRYVFEFDNNVRLNYFIEADYNSTLQVINLSSFEINGYFQVNNETPVAFITDSYTTGQLATPTFTSSAVDKHYQSIDDMLANQREQFVGGNYVVINEQQRYTWNGDENGLISDYTQVTMYTNLTADRWRGYAYNQNLNATSFTRELSAGDEVYMWFDVYIDFVGGGESYADVGYKFDGNFTIDATTTFIETDCQGVLVYEFLEKICQFVTDKQLAFRSDFFGRAELGYPEDGEGALYFITNGSKIRGLNARSIFSSFKDAFESLEAIFCLGWGFDTYAGQEVIRIEPKEYFYNKDNLAVELGNVSGLRKTAKRELYYKTVEVGYPKMEKINQVNGVDEFNQERQYTSPIQQAKGTLSLLTKMRASGYEIETQRRLTFKTDESRLDDEIFIIAVKYGSNSYIVEQGNSFVSVTGVFDPDTAYNLRITPARILRNWSKILATNCVYGTNKLWRFTSGTFNYQVTTKLASEGFFVEENGDLNVEDIEPLYVLESYEFEAKTVRAQRELIRNNQNGVISFLDWANVKRYGFLLNAKFQIEANKGVYTLLRSNAPIIQEVVTPPPPPIEPPAPYPIEFTYYVTYTAGVPNTMYLSIDESLTTGVPSIKVQALAGAIPFANNNVFQTLSLNVNKYEIAIDISSAFTGDKANAVDVAYNIYYKDDRGENYIFQSLLFNFLSTFNIGSIAPEKYGFSYNGAGQVTMVKSDLPLLDINQVSFDTAKLPICVDVKDESGLNTTVTLCGTSTSVNSSDYMPTTLNFNFGLTPNFTLALKMQGQVNTIEIARSILINNVL